MVICKYNCFARAHVHLSDYNFYSNFLTILDQHFSTDCKCKSPPLKSLSMSTCCAVGQKASSCANIKKNASQLRHLKSRVSGVYFHSKNFIEKCPNPKLRFKLVSCLYKGTQFPKLYKNPSKVENDFIPQFFLPACFPDIDAYAKLYTRYVSAHPCLQFSVFFSLFLCFFCVCFLRILLSTSSGI